MELLLVQTWTCVVERASSDLTGPAAPAEALPRLPIKTPEAAKRASQQAQRAQNGSPAGRVPGAPSGLLLDPGPFYKWSRLRWAAVSWRSQLSASVTRDDIGCISN